MTSNACYQGIYRYLVLKMTGVNTAWKIKKNFQVAIPKSLYLFTSAVLMCEKYVVHNTVAGLVCLYIL